jgi:hypothetical protein
VNRGQRRLGSRTKSMRTPIASVPAFPGSPVLADQGSNGVNLTGPTAPMHTPRFWTLLCSLLLMAGHAVAQDFLQHIVTSAFEDMAEIKRKAEAGDAQCQYKIANTLATQFHSTEALHWYSRAAGQGHLESFYQVGRLLFYGAIGIPSDQAVAANPTAGICIIYRAATNGHKAAFHDMYRAYNEGRAVAKDNVQAYAWLQLDVDSTRGLLPSPAQFELNRFALEVDVATSQKGKRLAALYRSGHWPGLVVQAPPEAKPATSTASTAPAPQSPPKPMPVLKLSAIAQGQRPTAFINGIMIGEGQTAIIPAKPESRVLKCLRIDQDSVLVGIDGIPDQIRLQIK